MIIQATAGLCRSRAETRQLALSGKNSCIPRRVPCTASVSVLPPLRGLQDVSLLYSVPLVIKGREGGIRIRFSYSYLALKIQNVAEKPCQG